MLTGLRKDHNLATRVISLISRDLTMQGCKHNLSNLSHLVAICKKGSDRQRQAGLLCHHEHPGRHRCRLLYRSLSPSSPLECLSSVTPSHGKLERAQVHQRCEVDDPRPDANVTRCFATVAARSRSRNLSLALSFLGRGARGGKRGRLSSTQGPSWWENVSAFL